jgi:segregation and condensation protein B
MGLKGKIEAIIYAAEEPVTLEQIAAALKESFAAEQGANGAEGDSQPALKQQLRAALDELVAEYAQGDRGMEIRQVAGGYRMATRPEHHDAVRSFVRSLKPPVRLSLQALETLAVIAYKQPVTVPEISEIRGVDSSGVIGTLLDRKLVTTAGRKAVIGRPILYRTSKEFLMRFGLKDIGELPSLEEFEKLAAESEELFAGRHGENGQPVSAQTSPAAAEPAPEAASTSPAADESGAADGNAGEENIISN